MHLDGKVLFEANTILVSACGGLFIEFFERYLVFWKFKVPMRLLIPALLISLLKVAGGVAIYYFLNIGDTGTFWTDATKVFTWPQNQVFLDQTSSAIRWPFTFLGWDSAWYLSIMIKGYTFSTQSYAFSPALPFFGQMFNLLFQNAKIALVVSALLFGVLWIPLYQALAENYMSKQAAFASSLLYGLSPYVFLFTTVAYAEGVFLFFALSSWVILKHGKAKIASVVAGFSALARIMGVLTAVPLLFGSLKQKGWRRSIEVILSFLPVFALFAWWTFLQTLSGDWLAAVHTTEWSGMSSLAMLLFNLPKTGFQMVFSALAFPATPYWLALAAMVLAFVVPPFLIYRAWRMDRALGTYSLAGYIGILVFGAIASAPRFVAVLFPLWMVLTARLSGSRKSAVVVLVLALVFLLVDLDMWIAFLNGQFVA